MLWSRPARLLALAIAGGIGSSAGGSSGGEIRAERVVAGQLVKAVARIAPELKCSNADSWMWGADQECPHQAITSLRVEWGRQKLFLPVSAYADLAGARWIEVNPDKQGFSIRIAGGDAATSYRAVLEFGGDPTRETGALRRREVRSGEFPDDAWEETRYSFNVAGESEPPIR